MKTIAIIIICCFIKSIAYTQISATGITVQNNDLLSSPEVSATTSGDCTGKILLADSCIKTGAAFQINASFPINAIVWSFGEPAGSNEDVTSVIAHHKYSKVGTFTVSAVVTLGCGVTTIERTIDIVDCTAPPACNANMQFSDSCLKAGITFTIRSTHQLQDVLWNFNDPQSGAANTSNGTSSKHTFSAAGSYTIAARVQMDCGTDTLLRTVTVVSCDTPDNAGCKVYLPTAFTPNGDHLNDNFGALSSCTFAAYELLVFNRWGEVVYDTKNVGDKWNGISKGHKCPAGNYICLVNYQFAGQPKKTARGNILLLR